MGRSKVTYGGNGVWFVVIAISFVASFIANIVLVSLSLFSAPEISNNPSSVNTATTPELIDQALVKAFNEYLLYARGVAPGPYYNPGGTVISTVDGAHFNEIMTHTTNINIHYVYQYLYDPNPLIRQMAVAVLSEKMGVNSIRMLTVMIADSHPLVRLHVIIAIGRIFPDNPYNYTQNTPVEITYRIALRDADELRSELIMWLKINHPQLHIE